MKSKSSRPRSFQSSLMPFQGASGGEPRFIEDPVRSQSRVGAARPQTWLLAFPNSVLRIRILLRLGLPNGLLPLSELKRDETRSVRDAPTRRQSNGETKVIVLIEPVKDSAVFRRVG